MYFWATDITGFKWGAEYPTDTTEYKLTGTYANHDSGSSCIMGPTVQINYILNTILSLFNTVKTDSQWGTVFPCSEKSKLPSFELLVGGYWFKVLAEDYSFAIDLTNTWCAICLRASSIDYFVLGIPFLRGWYTIFDNESKRIGYIPFNSSPKTNMMPTKAVTTPTIPLPGTEDNFVFGLTLI